MPLEYCPNCGSALSILSHRCRTCSAAASKLAWIEWFEDKHLLRAGLTLMAIVVFLYLLYRF